METQHVKEVIKALNGHNIFDFLTALLEKRQFQDFLVRKQFLDDLPALEILINHPDMMNCTRDITFYQFKTVTFWSLTSKTALFLSPWLLQNLPLLL